MGYRLYIISWTSFVSNEPAMPVSPPTARDAKQEASQHEELRGLGCGAAAAEQATKYSESLRKDDRLLSANIFIHHCLNIVTGLCHL